MNSQKTLQIFIFYFFKNELKIATDYKQVAVFVVFVVDLVTDEIRA